VGSKVSLLHGLCGNQGFLVTKKSIFLFDLKPDVFDVLVEGSHLLRSSFHDLLLRIPVESVDAFFQGDLFPFFIDRNADIDECLLLVVLAASDDKIDAEGMRSLHENSF
jgi:hypothetical protein